MKSNSKNRPLVFENLGNGAWHFNYNIEKVHVKNDSGVEELSYNYEQVKLWTLPTVAEVRKLVIAEKYEIQQEINLANGYRRFELGLSEDATLKQRYISYLNDVEVIKDMVATNFELNANQLQ